jgi:hypothetical protein
MDHYYHNASGSVVGGSGGGAAPVYHQQLPIAPSPVTATAGQKRKLVSSSSTTAVTGASTTAAQTTKSGTISRHGTAPAIIDSPVAAPAATPSNSSPSDYWKGLLKEWNVPILDTVGIEADDVDEKVNFLETTLDRIEAYQNIDLLAAVRRRDIPTLKRIAAEHAAKNSTMNACNRFGESILHLACRKGSLDVVELLVGGLPGCDCSLLVRDDYGRTVLHDACWTINPPWELIKLILKKAPVLWRVSDVRGHLAVQYIPKSAWPQWTAFLTKNKELLERIMVHSYHGVDIAMQSQSAPSADASSSTTNNKSSTETTNVPQHQQQVQPSPQPQFFKPLPATVPVSAHNSSSSIQGAAAAESSTISAADASKAAVTQRHAAAKESISVALALATGGGMAQASAEQANAVLARALAQANPAMVQALSQGAQHRKLEQGVLSVESSLVSSSRSPQQTRPALPMKVVPAPGPATAALDEALKAQSKARTLQRSEQKQQPPAQLAHKQPAAAEQLATSPTKHSPLPYAPSISMIAERLAGYQKAASARKDQQQKQQQEEQPTGSESTSPKQAAVVVPNPLPAVPNPLLTSTENMAVKQGQEPTTPEATTVNVPNPMAGAGESSLQHTSEEATTGSDGGDDDDDREEEEQHSNSNSMSDVTMSASPSVVEISSSSNAATDTDNSEDASPDATTTDNEQKEADQHDSGSSNNAKKTGKLVVG